MSSVELGKAHLYLSHTFLSHGGAILSGSSGMCSGVGGQEKRKKRMKAKI